MREHDRSSLLRGAACGGSAQRRCMVAVLLSGMSLAMGVATAGAQVVANPGPIVLTLDFLDVRYETAPAFGKEAVGFRFDANAPPECSDGRNNDDHSGFAQGVQDMLVDYPADPECATPWDDSEDKPEAQARDAVVLIGRVDALGRLEFPAAGVTLPPRYHQSVERLLGGDGVVINTYEASAPVTGRVDPERGTLELELRLRLRFEVERASRLSGPGANCYLGSATEPQTIVLIGDRRSDITGIDPRRPRGYYATDGSFVLAGTNAERVDGASCCGLLCFGDGAVDDAFGMPADRGAMTVAAIGRIDPPLISPAARSRDVKARAASVPPKLDLEPRVDALSHLGDVRDHTDETAALLKVDERRDREIK